MPPATVLLTGATGFVGRSLAAELCEHKHPVVAAVRRHSALLPEHVRQTETGDLSADGDWTTALAGVDVIVHLAARVHVLRDTSADPLAAFRHVNVDATLNLARQALASGVKRFVFISSIGVNGAETWEVPFSEASIPHPHSPYAVSKYEAEQGLWKLCDGSQMELVVIRPPLIYGPDAPGNFRSMVKFVGRGIPLPLKSVRNRRSMAFLGNLVNFISLCVTDARAANQLFLIADAAPVSVPELVNALSQGMGKRPRMFAFPEFALRWGAQVAGRRNMYLQLCGSLEIDIAKARSLLGWIPPVSIHEGLRLTAEAYLNETSF